MLDSTFASEELLLVNLENKFDEFAEQLPQIVVVNAIHERLHGVADLDRGGDD